MMTFVECAICARDRCYGSMCKNTNHASKSRRFESKQFIVYLSQFFVVRHFVDFYFLHLENVEHALYKYFSRWERERKHMHVKAISHRYSILTSTIYKYLLKYLQWHRRFKSISHESKFLLNWKFPSNRNETNIESISCCFALKLQFAVVLFDSSHIHSKNLISMNIRI